MTSGSPAGVLEVRRGGSGEEHAVDSGISGLAVEVGEKVRLTGGRTGAPRKAARRTETGAAACYRDLRLLSFPRRHPPGTPTQHAALLPAHVVNPLQLPLLILAFIPKTLPRPVIFKINFPLFLSFCFALVFLANTANDIYTLVVEIK